MQPNEAEKTYPQPHYEAPAPQPNELPVQRSQLSTDSSYCLQNGAEPTHPLQYGTADFKDVSNPSQHVAPQVPPVPIVFFDEQLMKSLPSAPPENRAGRISIIIAVGVPPLFIDYRADRLSHYTNYYRTMHKLYVCRCGNYCVFPLRLRHGAAYSRDHRGDEEEQGSSDRSERYRDAMYSGGARSYPLA